MKHLAYISMPTIAYMYVSTIKKRKKGMRVGNTLIRLMAIVLMRSKFFDILKRRNMRRMRVARAIFKIRAHRSMLESLDMDLMSLVAELLSVSSKIYESGYKH